jgi:quinoprotein glucose dehydrogenase
VHHDIWDYDTQSAPLLVDLRRDGQIVPAVIIVNKTGLMFTFNRVTGKPLFDIEERPVPKATCPASRRRRRSRFRSSRRRSRRTRSPATISTKASRSISRTANIW